MKVSKERLETFIHLDKNPETSLSGCLGSMARELLELRASHDKTWNAAIESAEYVVKERAAQLSERSKRPLYSIRQKIRSLLRIRPGD